MFDEFASRVLKNVSKPFAIHRNAPLAYSADHPSPAEAGYAKAGAAASTLRSGSAAAAEDGSAAKAGWGSGPVPFDGKPNNRPASRIDSAKNRSKPPESACFRGFFD